jgi:hypothetical protein
MKIKIYFFCAFSLIFQLEIPKSSLSHISVPTFYSNFSFESCSLCRNPTTQEEFILTSIKIYYGGGGGPRNKGSGGPGGGLFIFEGLKILKCGNGGGTGAF